MHSVKEKGEAQLYIYIYIYTGLNLMCMHDVFTKRLEGYLPNNPNELEFIV